MRLAVARLGWLALCLVPLSVALGRLWYIYVAPAEGIPYQYRSVALTPTDALVVLICVGWLAWRWRTGRRLRLPRGSRLVLAALGLLVLATAASVASAYDRVLAVGVTAQLGLLVLFFLAASELLAGFPQRQLLLGIAVAVAGQFLLIAWQAAAQTTAPAGTLFNGWASELTSRDQGASVVILPIVGRWLRSYGSFPHPNILGGFLALSLAVVAITAAPSPTLPRERGNQLGELRARRLRVVVLALGFTGLLLTFSRAAWLAVLLGVLTWLVLAREAPTPLPSAQARFAIASVIAVVALLVLVRVESLGSLVERNSIETRLFYNSVAWDVIARGIPVGAGNLVVAQQHLLGVSSAGSEPAHNVFLIALAELGPLGLVAWVAVFSSLLVAAWQRRTDLRMRAGPLVAVSVLVPLLLFDHYLWTQSAGRVLLVWTLALLMGLRPAERTIEATFPYDRPDNGNGFSRLNTPTAAARHPGGHEDLQSRSH